MRAPVRAAVSEGHGRAEVGMGANGHALRTTRASTGSTCGRRNIVESPFASVRLRTTGAKRQMKVENATALIWKAAVLRGEDVPEAQRAPSARRCGAGCEVRGRSRRRESLEEGGPRRRRLHNY